MIHVYYATGKRDRGVLAREGFQKSGEVHYFGLSGEAAGTTKWALYATVFTRHEPRKQQDYTDFICN